MFAAVIPALKLPRQLTGPFDYSIPDALASAVGVGSVVMVPWRGRNVAGLVFAVRETAQIDPKKTKPISAIVGAERVPAELLSAFEWMASHYMAAPGTVVNCFLPTVPKRSVTKAEALADLLSKARNSKKRKATAVKGSVVRYATPAAKYEEAFRLVKTALAAKRGAIIVVPHAEDVVETVALLKREFGDDAVVECHGDMAMTPLWKSWQRAASPEPVVVVGTRMAVGSPVSDLGAIIVLESDSADLKQYDQNPRYDSRAVALHRARAAGAAIAYLSHAPRAEEYALVRDEGFSWKEVGTGKDDISLAEPGRDARSAEERLFTPAAHQATEEALHSQKKVLLFHNRRGTATAMLCRDCGRLERCPTCEIALRVHADQLHCHRCGSKRPLPLLCEDCGSASLRISGLGTGAVTPLLAAAFPDAKAEQFDTDTREVGKKMDLGRADIAVGTQLLLHNAAESIDAPTFGAVVATSVDGLLGHPGFRTTENAWRTLRTLADVAGAGEGKTVLQTLDGESPDLRALLVSPEAFLQGELASRDKAGYPPKTSLITVTAVGRSEDSARATISKLVREFKAKGGSALISGPLRPGNPFRHGSWRSLLVIKTQTLTPELEAALRQLPEDCIIDRDPDYLG